MIYFYCICYKLIWLVYKLLKVKFYFLNIHKFLYVEYMEICSLFKNYVNITKYLNVYLIFLNTCVRYFLNIYFTFTCLILFICIFYVEIFKCFMLIHFIFQSLNYININSLYLPSLSYQLYSEFIWKYLFYPCIRLSKIYICYSSSLPRFVM
jgi:hypothetical protein